MHKKYGKDGLQVISVSLDTVEGSAAEKKETTDRVYAFLRDKGADFTNLLLGERVDWDQKFHFIAPPCYFVFDKQGKWRQFLADETPVDYATMEALVVKLLKDK
jgi:hypothetical protein